MLMSNSVAAICCSTTTASWLAISSCLSPAAFVAAHPLRRRLRKAAPLRQPCIGDARCYATQPTNPDSVDVPPWPRSSNPTPYEILNMRRGEPYTKRRFYQLAKLYHPDTHDKSTTSTTTPSHSQLSNETRLERYRLVVAAHDLLSDPNKRRLYDHHGVGWTDGHSAPDLRDADKAWRHQPGNAARNATWEDWERWREERDGHRTSEPMYMSNGTFAALVVCMCMIGALTQMNRAEAAGEQYVDFVTEKDWAIGQKMRQNTIAAEGRSKDERVDRFLRNRENLTFEYQRSKFDSPPPSDRSE